MKKLRWSSVWVGIFLILMALMARTAHSEIQIPKQSDWTDHGTIINPGASGEWDLRLVGGFSPCAVIKKNGTYFVYYIGANGGRTDDNGPAFRALGVITSTDGVNFSKYSGNPVIEHFPTNDQEEGVFTCGATVENGEILMYVGTMFSFAPSQVNDDGKLYTSTDGFNFTLDKMVLDHTDSFFYGAGDEFDPFGVFKHPTNGTWFMYYSAGTAGDKWDLGYAKGPARDDFHSESGASITDQPYIVGGGDPIFIAPDKIVIFLDRVNGWSNWFTEARTASIDSPQDVSASVTTYDFTDTMGTAFYLDKDVGKWFMFYNKGTEQHTNNPALGTTIGLRTAPCVGCAPPDSTPPSTPTNLSATAISSSQIDLAWTSASDPESGISSYNIYRNNVSVGTASTTSFSDTGLSEGTTHTYQISAVNGGGVRIRQESSSLHHDSV